MYFACNRGGNMKNIIIASVLAVMAIACGCGGGGSSMTTSGGQKVIDPSGNWTMTAQDQQGNKLVLAALFNQVGAVVTANSFTAPNNPNLTCNPLNLTFSNGLVANVSTFTGTLGGAFGSLAFTGTLNDAGTAVTGTYTIANLNNCGGIGATGTFTGAEVPSVSGNWTGTLQPCTRNPTTGDCPITQGTASSAISFSLTQNDATGAVDGTYQVANLAGFSNGAVSISKNTPQGTINGLLSGQSLQFAMGDVNGKNYLVANGLPNTGLGLDRTYKAVVQGPFGFADNFYFLTISH
jgi:hypothetical protein